ncbi:hypothetical protein CK204_27240, partial [Klebsiella pneumoniae]
MFAAISRGTQWFGEGGQTSQEKNEKLVLKCLADFDECRAIAEEAPKLAKDAGLHPRPAVE